MLSVFVAIHLTASSNGFLTPCLLMRQINKVIWLLCTARSTSLPIYTYIYIGSDCLFYNCLDSQHVFMFVCATHTQIHTHTTFRSAFIVHYLHRFSLYVCAVSLPTFACFSRLSPASLAFLSLLLCHGQVNVKSQTFRAFYGQRIQTFDKLGSHNF